jgi:hypothetical protein
MKKRTKIEISIMITVYALSIIFIAVSPHFKQEDTKVTKVEFETKLEEVLYLLDKDKSITRTSISFYNTFGGGRKYSVYMTYKLNENSSVDLSFNNKSLEKVLSEALQEYNELERTR